MANSFFTLPIFFAIKFILSDNSTATTAFVRKMTAYIFKISKFLDLTVLCQLPTFLI